MWRSSLSKDDGVTPYTLDLRAKYGDPLVLDESLVGQWTVIKIGSRYVCASGESRRWPWRSGRSRRLAARGSCCTGCCSWRRSWTGARLATLPSGPELRAVVAVVVGDCVDLGRREPRDGVCAAVLDPPYQPRAACFDTKTQGIGAFSRLECAQAMIIHREGLVMCFWSTLFSA